MVKRSFRRNQRVGKKRSRAKKSKTKNYSRKRFYKRSKRLMRGGWGSGGGKKYGDFYQTGGNPLSGGWQ